MMRIASFLLCSTVLAAAACGPSIPSHKGYPVGEKAPWSKPKRIILDDQNKGDTEGTLDYPKRQRAAWYSVVLPGEGSLSVTMTQDPLANKATTDVEVEVLDEGYNVVAKGDDDEGNEKKERLVQKARPGKTYIHVFTRGKLDRADYVIKVAFKPVVVDDPRSKFPYNVPMPDQIAAVPTQDDTPGKPRIRDPKPRDPKPRDPKPDTTSDDGGGTGKKATARISEYSEEGGSVRIVLNKGEDNGIVVGQKGYIMSTATKKKLPGSDFEVSTVRSQECEAKVNVSVDDVEKNRVVILKGSN
jgi:hypothetical protein